VKPELMQGAGRLTPLLIDACRELLSAWDDLDGHKQKTVDAFKESVAELARLLPSPPADYDPHPYIATNRWTYARTMPENPHEYVVLRKSTDPYEHLRFLAWIRGSGNLEHFKGRDYEFVEIDGWRYWAMGTDQLEQTIINRRVVPSET
jgi:hypothetical protein